MYLVIMNEAGNGELGRLLFVITAWWQKNSYPCMSFCMSFCLVGYEFFCHQAVYYKVLFLQFCGLAGQVMYNPEAKIENKPFTQPYIEFVIAHHKNSVKI